MTLEQIHSKYYSNIPLNVYLEIVYADPTTKRNKGQKGGYCQWLLNLYKNGNLLVEDLYKATEYLKIYTQYKHKILQDVNKLNSLVELFQLVAPFMEKEDSIFTNDEERKLAGEFEQVYKDDKWRIIIPLTLKASQYFGRGTQWCTIRTNQFNNYTNRQTKEITPYNLYILIPTNKNWKERLQFHFIHRQFMDIKDNPYHYDFFNNNIHIFNFFNKYFPVLRYTNLYEFYKKGERLDEYEIKAIKFIDSIFNKLTLIKNANSPNIDFYIDKNNNKLYMENPKNGYLFCERDIFWKVLDNEYYLFDHQIEYLIKCRLEKFPKLNDLPQPSIYSSLHESNMIQFFKLNELRPICASSLAIPISTTSRISLS